MENRLLTPRKLTPRKYLRTTTAALLLACAALCGCGPLTFVVGVSPGDQKPVATVVESDTSSASDRVAIIEVSGLIHNGRSPGLISEGENPVSLLAECLRAAADDSHVKAVVLRINSPGGTVTASDAMYREVLRFKRETGKPVVALMMDVAASGGYYVSCSADKIVAYPTTVTGSIGVILQTISIKPALTYLNIKTDAIVSGPNKDAGSPLSNMTPDQRDTLQQLVNDYYHRFQTVVREHRPGIAAERFAMVTDGRVFSGDQGLAVGLVDQLGDLEDAYALAKSLAHVEKAKLVVYHRPLNYAGSAYAGAPGLAPGAAAGAGRGTQINIAQFNLGEALQWDTGGFYYLWTPAGR